MSNYRLHLLPTDKANADICKVMTTFQVMVDDKLVIFEAGRLYNYNELEAILRSTRHQVKLRCVKMFHLYLTDNQRILKGTWCIEHGRLYKSEKNEGPFSMSGDDRIICSTDTDLRQDVYINEANNNTVEENVPHFDYMFLWSYIEMYNRGQQLINNVQPRIEIYSTKERERFVIDEDNKMSVLIKIEKPLKPKMYTRAELDTHLLAVMNLGMTLRQNQLSGDSHMSGVDILEQYKYNNL